MKEEIWDIIVVGAGSAGAAFAVRSAQKGKRVLLVEAGRDYRSAEMHEAWRSPNPAVPLMDPDATEGMVWTDLNATRTDVQPEAPYWRGKGVGGSSSINGQIAIRPPLADFADWSSAGCEGWSAADVLPYFAKLENDEEFGDADYHGNTGPTPIFRTPRDRWGAVDSALAESALASGHPWAPDVNAPRATGVSPYPINSRDSRRVSVNDAYLEGARELPTLTILGEAVVDRVLFEGTRAVGVSLLSGGDMERRYADTTVLSAGVIHSPTILLRSGIGPAQQLESLGIDVLADLPVGQGLQDHAMVTITLPLKDSAGLTSPDDRHTNVCVRWSSAPEEGNEGERDDDLMFVSMNQSVISMATANTGAEFGAYGVWLNRSESRGTVTLASPDPGEQPVVAERMLSDPGDRARLRHGVRSLVGLLDQDATQAILGGPVRDCNEELFSALDDDDALDAHLLATVADAQHGTSTCRMGSADDPHSVVDSDCRVHGFERLHVVDASIFPSAPRANTNLASIMVGELLADRIH
ncbi:GMC family oxidoreductase N-terminal domain-containing protein [Brevibacterium marinum]|uniref:Choline dehydrogenase n=1 Tax=Brevibacterium marinum TaxID=418643 RepID=A0A846S3Y5_9MICO|nr:choline dehydrogenase [Brevibacterium marinum]